MGIRRLAGAAFRAGVLVPGIGPRLAAARPHVKRVRDGLAADARYCYAAWLHHLVHARRQGLDDCPRVVAEIGPGSSLGTGLAALISGSSRYHALDVVDHATAEANLLVFDRLVGLFGERAPIPGGDEFDRVYGWLDSHEFPSHILDEERLGRALEPGRLARIRRAAGSPGAGEAVTYSAPWSDGSVGPGTVDCIFSQETMEHVDGLPRAYRIIGKMLRPGGYASHKISFHSHGTTPEWNGHWACGDLAWRKITSDKAYLINREPLSGHLRMMREAGMEIRSVVRTGSGRGRGGAVARGRLAGRFRSMSDDDLATRSAFVQAVAPK